MQTLADQTQTDLLDDLNELRFLATAMRDRLRVFSAPSMIEEIKSAIAGYDRVLAELDYCDGDLHALKVRAIDFLRTHQGVSAALLASTDWQSPSFAYTLRSQAGRQEGKIEATISDYKRDVHLDAKAYEKAFGETYINHHGLAPLHVYVTVSGMAAFSTAIVCLQTQGEASGNVLVGKNSYFENKDVLDRLFRDRVYEVDEMNIDDVVTAIKKYRPSIIVLDSLCNTAEIAVPDLARLIPAIAKVVNRPTTLVLDNTGLASTLQPLDYLPRGMSKLKLVVIESLNKYHQFGFDRVTGGVIWRQGFTPTKLSACRMHLGTIMPDASVLAMPEPNREMLEQRLKRLERNTLILAGRLDERIRSLPRTMLSHVVYPGLESYRGYSWTKEMPFRGSYFTVAFKKPFALPMFYKRFVNVVLEEAKKANIQMTSGTSFGFSTTRIYLTALHAKKHAKPFVRVSVGTETMEEVEKLCAVFARGADRLSL